MPDPPTTHLRSRVGGAGLRQIAFPSQPLALATLSFSLFSSSTLGACWTSNMLHPQLVGDGRSWINGVNDTASLCLVDPKACFMRFLRGSAGSLACMRAAGTYTLLHAVLIFFFLSLICSLYFLHFLTVLPGITSQIVYLQGGRSFKSLLFYGVYFWRYQS